MCGDFALVLARCAHGAQTTRFQWLVTPNRHARIRPRCPKPARAKWLFCKGLGGLGAWGATFPQTVKASFSVLQVAAQ
jgi:hypothetical protein